MQFFYLFFFNIAIYKFLKNIFLVIIVYLIIYFLKFENQ